MRSKFKFCFFSFLLVWVSCGWAQPSFKVICEDASQTFQQRAVSLQAKAYESLHHWLQLQKKARRLVDLLGVSAAFWGVCWLLRRLRPSSPLPDLETLPTQTSEEVEFYLRQACAHLLRELEASEDRSTPLENALQSNLRLLLAHFTSLGFLELLLAFFAVDWGTESVIRSVRTKPPAWKKVEKDLERRFESLPGQPRASLLARLPVFRSLEHALQKLNLSLLILSVPAAGFWWQARQKALQLTQRLDHAERFFAAQDWQSILQVWCGFERIKTESDVF